MRDEDKDGGRGLQLVKAEDDQNVRFQKIFITPPPPSFMEPVTGNSKGGGGSEAEISKGYGGIF